MTNFSKITLQHKRDEISKSIVSLKRSMESLKDQRSDYAEHHQLVINTYRDILHRIDDAILDSEFVGKGI